MFKERYKRANHEIRLTEEDKNAMLNSIHEKKQKKKSHVPHIAAAVALCMLVAVFGGIMLMGESGFLSQWNKVKLTETAKSYSEIFEKLEQSRKRDYLQYGGYDTIEDTNDMAAIPESSVDTKNDVAMGGESSKDYSDTNVQVEGVDEADKIKTDGDYIYALNYKSGIDVYKADGGDTKHVGTIALEEENDNSDKSYRYITYSDMYLHNGKLIVIVDEHSENGLPAKGVYDTMYGEGRTTCVCFFDVEDPAEAKLISRLSQDGSYLRSRISDGVLYILSNYGVYMHDELDPNKPETYIPATYADDECELIAPEDITILENDKYSSYTVISAIDTSDVSQCKSSVALLGSVRDIYASAENIIAYQAKYDTAETKIRYNDDGSYEKLSDDADSGTYLVESAGTTRLYLISMNGGELEVTADTTISGDINNQFSIDEYDGYFRILTTTNDLSYIYMEFPVEYGGGESMNSVMNHTSSMKNTLYVLDAELNEVGRIDNIAEGEHIKSARFMGDIGYFVTFRQTDPLFSADLSDPENPRIIGSLKIPGFSEYLQSYGEGLLLGFGSAADIETGGVYGLKLSMFDISDPSDVREIACEEIEGAGSSASYNHKAILADPEKNIIGFPSDSDYMIYSYTDGKFKLEGSILCDDEWTYDRRGLYIDDFYYVVDTEMRNITVLNIKDFRYVTNVSCNGAKQ